MIPGVAEVDVYLATFKTAVKGIEKLSKWDDFQLNHLLITLGSQREAKGKDTQGSKKC